MSRVIVKGLPPTISDAQLRTHFSRAFPDEITDVKVARTKDGRVRQFAFLGFRGAGTAASAVASFDRTFFGASRLSVEVAKAIGEGVPAAVAASSAAAAALPPPPRAPPGDDTGELAAELGVGRFAAKAAQGVKDKALLAEFLAASRSRASAPTWANDDALTRGGGGGAKAAAGAARARSGSGSSSSDDDEYQELPSKGSGTVPVAAAAAAAPPPPPGSAAGDLEDLAFLRSKMAAAKPRKGEVAAAGAVAADDAAPAPVPAPAPAEEPAAGAGGAGEGGAGGAPPLAETGRLFLRNLPYVATEVDVRSHFAPFGAVADATLLVDGGGRSKGIAYVTFVNPESAVEALAGTDGRVFLGRLLHVLPARAARDEEGGEGGGGGGGGAPSSSFKRTREEARKRAAVGGAEAGTVWNTLFVRSDAAVAAAAAALGVGRGELLDRDASNLAVRAALAETKVVADTKQFLADNGVCLPTLESALAGAAAAGAAVGGGGARGSNTTSAGGAGGGGAATVARSATTILVKNLPPECDAALLRDMFSRQGHLTRFLLPPARVLCIAEYADAKAAKRAFAALAYAKFHRAPLYLEWAPEAIFERAAEGPPMAIVERATASGDGEGAGGGGGGGGASKPASAPPAPPAPAPPAAAGAVTTLFIKNLSFASTEDGLRGVFAGCGALRSVRIPRKRAPARGGKGEKEAPLLSLGYGFVEFADAAGAAAALRTKQGVALDGHALELSESRAGGGGGGEGGAPPPPPPAAAAAAKAARAAAADAAATKLMVRNLAFEATKRDLAELFSAFGTLKTVRLPKKFDGTGRGFAFVEFITHAEARAAMAALASTHLYGRHLVIEWAAAGEGGGAAEGPAAEPAAPAAGKRARAAEPAAAGAAPSKGAAAAADAAQARALAREKRKREA
jgi:multiple RNA-binding domain-containing protein 1